MIRGEIKKIIKQRTVLAIFIAVNAVLFYSMFVYGIFGYDISRYFLVDSPRGYASVSEYNGKFLFGQEAYDRNKYIAGLFTGEVTDSFLEKIHRESSSSTYFKLYNGKKIFNSTFEFFRNAFFIESEDYFRVADVLDKNAGTIFYGFTGDWDAFGHIIDMFFTIFAFFIIVFASPLFTYDKECGMSETLITVEKGNYNLYKYKMAASFICINILFFAFIAIISISHFSQVGFDNANVSIQMSFELRYLFSPLESTMGQLTAVRLFFAFIGSNMILLITNLVSMLSKSTLASFATSMVVVYSGSYLFVHLISDTYGVNLLFSIFPINLLEIWVLMENVPSWNVLVNVLLVHLVLFMVLLIIIKNVWRKKMFVLTE